MNLIGNKGSLKPIEENDINHEFVDWLNDAEVMNFLGISKTLSHTLESTKKWVGKTNQDSDKRLWGIFGLEGDLIGHLRLDIEWTWGVCTINIGIYNKKFWGMGIGTEVINLATNFAFNHLNMQKVEAGVLEGNTGSLKAFQKAGFKIEGIREKRRYNNGKYVNDILLGRVKIACKKSNCDNTFK